MKRTTSLPWDESVCVFNVGNKMINRRFAYGRGPKFPHVKCTIPLFISEATVSLADNGRRSKAKLQKQVVVVMNMRMDFVKKDGRMEGLV